jgi:hypothetical protein
MEQTEITIRNIDVALTKINIQPGDVLLVSVPHLRSMNDRQIIQESFKEALGVPACILSNGMKVDAVLSIAPECLELAASERSKRADEYATAMRKVMGSR